MSNSSTILHKKNYVSGVVPTVTSLSSGEIAINVSDGKLFVKTISDTIESFSNDSNLPFILDKSLSGVNTQYGNNTISEVFSNVLGGYNNDVTGGGSTVINGENNDIDSDYSTILNGLDNKISINSDYSVILGGQYNLITHENVFTLGSNLSSHANDFTYVNNISAQGYFYGDGSNLTGVIAAGVVGPDSEVRALTANWESTYLTVGSLSAAWASSSGEYLPLSGGALTGTIVGDLSATGSFYGDGSNLTGIIAGDSEATTLVRSNSANWDSVYTSYNANSASIDASYITSGTLNAARLPTFNGDITADTSNSSVSATVVAIQGNPISVQTPSNGQTLQWNGTAWTPGTIPTGGSGGGGLLYYFNQASSAQSPTTNLPPTPQQLGRTGLAAQTTITSSILSQANYTLVAGFVTDILDPNIDAIPAGLWDFNVWGYSNATTNNPTVIQAQVYKYDGVNAPVLLSTSDDTTLTDSGLFIQHQMSCLVPQTSISLTDRIYVEIRAKASAGNKTVSLAFGDSTPTHIHTTLPSVGGSGLVKVIDGVIQSPASLLVNTDVSANAAIDQSKINGLTDVAVKSNSVFTTVQSASANWETTFAASSAYVSSNPTGITGASALTKLLQITQAGYNALTPASDTLYVIVG